MGLDCCKIGTKFSTNRSFLQLYDLSILFVAYDSACFKKSNGGLFHSNGIFPEEFTFFLRFGTSAIL